MRYVFIKEQRCLSLRGTVIVWATRTWNINRQSSCWIQKCGSVMNSHRVGYTNINQSSLACVLYDWTFQRILFRILCFILNLRYTEYWYILMGFTCLILWKNCVDYLDYPMTNKSINVLLKLVFPIPNIIISTIPPPNNRKMITGKTSKMN